MGSTLDNISAISTGYLIRVGSQGDLRWKKVIEDVDTHPFPNRTTFDDGIYQAEDSTFIIGGSIAHYSDIHADQRNLTNRDRDAYFLNITSVGTRNWQYTIQREGNQFIRTLYSVPSADTSRIIAGGESGQLGYLVSIEYTDATDTKTESNSSIVKSFQFSQNFPNPFNPSTSIRFNLLRASNVQLTVYNTIGQKIKTLINRRMTTGSHSVTFNGEGLPSGVYIYRLKAGEYSESRKMLLMK